MVQIDGGHHVGLQRAEDVAHDAALTLLGYHVIRVTYTAGDRPLARGAGAHHAS